MIGKLDSREPVRQNGEITPIFALPGWSILALEGADALAFGQAQLMNDVDRLADGRWQWNGWLNAKGRVIALCIALRRDGERLWLLLPEMPAAELSAALQRYVFRSRLKLREPAHWQVAGQFLDSNEPGDCELREQADGHLVMHFGNAGENDHRQRRLLLLPEGTVAPQPSSEAAACWQACDLKAGLPHLDTGQREQHTPQMLSLERLRAYSVKKGCYPGQEIVSRTHYLGKAKRGLCRLCLPPGSEHRPGDAVTDDNGRPLSTLLNVAATSEGSEALAILGDDSTACVDGMPVERLPLLDCLPR